MGEMRRAIAREEQDGRRMQDRFASTLVIAASIIAAVRLAREPLCHTFFVTPEDVFLAAMLAPTARFCVTGVLKSSETLR
jgi:hypothetical protein